MLGEIYEELGTENLIPVSKEEGEFISNFLKRNNIKKTLEVGFAYGCSAAAIISATQSRHYAIDPFQKRDFQNAGIKNMERLGFRRFLDFREEFSDTALPRMLMEGVRVDFAFIDGLHLFDSIFVDFYFIDMILEENGYVCFHDYWMPSTRAVISWIANNKKNYEIIDVSVGELIIVKKVRNEERRWDHFIPFNAGM
ncbi:methyltransferase family protein [Ruminiclostridium sufflavum DSM 19573]|uniref:Methyltransferase family protein n=1 Tax=Ruminiclostridium sufflavum DSM 19573 TaxID=1121337 RepID=A0A318XKI1_9FIRM|nr:class I SAM-dependent methyltransferase [Ruminiclostridium sufflavum]PYG87945.1 methyltransferase family protein [Ruminiclostridium sufflavum DSM 19573]